MSCPPPPSKDWQQQRQMAKAERGCFVDLFGKKGYGAFAGPLMALLQRSQLLLVRGGGVLQSAKSPTPSPSPEGPDGGRGAAKRRVDLLCLPLLQGFDLRFPPLARGLHLFLELLLALLQLFGQLLPLPLLNHQLTYSFVELRLQRLQRGLLGEAHLTLAGGFGPREAHPPWPACSTERQRGGRASRPLLRCPPLPPTPEPGPDSPVGATHANSATKPTTGSNATGGGLP